MVDVCVFVLFSRPSLQVDSSYALRAPTRVMVDHIFKALEGELGGDVVPAVVQPEDPIVLYLPVPHRQ